MTVKDVNSDSKLFIFLLESLKKKFTKIKFDNTILYYGDIEIGLLFPETMLLNINRNNEIINEGLYYNYDLALFLNNYDLKNTLSLLLRNTKIGDRVMIIGSEFYEKINNKLFLRKQNVLKIKYGKDFLKQIPIYDGFIMEPDNINFKPIIGNMYNYYSPPKYKPSNKEGSFRWIKILMNHIFGDQINVGYKYMKLLYEHPKSKTYTLALVSDERETGKSTFINFLNEIFGENMTIVNPQDIESGFNGAYAKKNIIAIEESKFDKFSTLEKLKDLATRKMLNVNEKFVTRYELPFFGKIIITSNSEDKFIRIDEDETRYWIRKIPKFDKKYTNHNILEDIKKEIPYFLRFLLNMKKLDVESRFVIKPDEIKNDALLKTKKESKNELFKTLLEQFEDIFNNNQFVKELLFIPVDIKNHLFYNNSRIQIPYIKKVISEDFKLEKHKKNLRYRPLELTPEYSKIGAPYILTKEKLNELKKFL